MSEPRLVTPSGHSERRIMSRASRTLRRIPAATAVAVAVAAAALATAAPASALPKCSNAQVNRLNNLDAAIGLDTFWYDYYGAAVESDMAHLDDAIARQDQHAADQYVTERNDDLYWRNVIWREQLHEDQSDYDDIDLSCSRN
jgi:hypothetical protein